MHSYIIYSICRPPKVIVRRIHKIMLNFYKKKKKKKKPTYLPKLKLMGRSTANKYNFKDGFVQIYFRDTFRVSNSLDNDQDRQNSGPNLGPNCMRRFSSAEDKIRRIH